MKHLILSVALLFSPAAAFAAPPPAAPPGSGTAEWHFHRTVMIEAEIFHDAWAAVRCGLRSPGWVGQIKTGFSIQNTQMVAELTPKATDPVRFRDFAEAEMHARFGQAYAEAYKVGVSRESCAPYLAELPRLDNVVDQMWGYR